MKDDYQEAMEWIDDIVNSIYNARGAIYEKPEEDYYKEHGKYV
jgi:hypothetical protein